MFVIPSTLLCTLLLSTLLWVNATAPTPSQCVPREIQNMVIDVTNAVAKGARFSDPVNAASAEECISECCSRINRAGERSCSLAVYDTRKTNVMQNCYLFLCPQPESCPMSPAPGVLSYSFWAEKAKSNPESTEEVLIETPKSKSNVLVQNSPAKKVSPPNHVAGPAELEDEVGQHEPPKKSSSSDVPTQSKSTEAPPLSKQDKAETPDRITSQLLHLANNIDQRLEKIEAGSMEGKGSESLELPVSPTEEKLLVEPTTTYRHKDSKKMSSDTKVVKKKPEAIEVHRPTPKPRTTVGPPIRTSQHVSTTGHRPVPDTKPPFPPLSKESKTAKKVPNSDTKIAKVLSSGNSLNMAVTEKNMRVDHLVTTTQVPTTSTVHQATSALPLTQHNSAKSTLDDGDPSVTGLTSPEQQEPVGDTKGAPRNVGSLDTILGDGNRSGLVAALVFGVMFLLLVIGLVSHKVSEARRRHRYTKLDYLINGMYVDT